MTLEAKLTEIQGILTLEHFPSEAAVSLGIVLPILRELNWATDNPMVVWPEHPAGKGKVDFALCDPTGHSKVKAFIEVKGLGGKTESAVKQVMDYVFEYAFESGVRIAVLTDGRTWSFYLPLEEGSYEERRVFKLDLSEHSSPKSSKILQDYLEKSRVVSGEAFEAALRDLRDRRRLEKARRAIPSTWGDIFEASEPDESLNSLVGVLAGRVESKVGVRPDDSDIVDFLRSLQIQKGPVSSPPGGNGGKGEEGKDEGNQSGRSGKLVILGKSFHYRDAKDAMVTVFKELENREPGFCQRFYNDPRNRGRTRRIIAQDAGELYDLDRLAKNHERIEGNWVIGTNNSNRQKEKIIKIAADVARLEFGRDIIISFDA